MRILFVPVFVFVPFLLLSQSISKKLIIDAMGDSTLLKRDPVFNENGDYFIEKYDESSYLTFNGQTLGPFDASTTFSNKGQTTFYYSPGEGAYYYKNYAGTTLYGPVKGDAKQGDFSRGITEGSKNDIAITLLSGDSVFYYINQTLVHKVPRLYFKENDDWCRFSPNGNSIYFIKENNKYKLYRNFALLDSNDELFYELNINDNSFYTYAKGHRPLKRLAGDYHFYVHTPKGRFGPVRTVWSNNLSADNDFWYSGNDNETDYLMVNGKIYRYDGIADLQVKGDYFSLTYDKDNKRQLVINGNDVTGYSTLEKPFVGVDGSHAYFIQENYYLYKVVNGQTQKDPISKYGVRAAPVYINTSGNSLYYFETDDSIYLYKDDSLLLPGFSTRKTFEVNTFDNVYISGHKIKSTNKEDLRFIVIDSATYINYRGYTTPGLPFVIGSGHGEERRRTIESAIVNEHGWSIVFKENEKDHIVIANGNKYISLKNVDRIIDANTEFDGRVLTLYGVEGLSMFKYTITL